MATPLEGLRTVIYPTEDLDASKLWWSAFLGYAPYFDEPFYVGFSVAGYELGLLPDANPDEGAITFWGVDDVTGAVREAIDAGANEHTPVTDVGDGIITASVVTPDGSIVGFIVNPHFKLD